MIFTVKIVLFSIFEVITNLATGGGLIVTGSHGCRRGRRRLIEGRRVGLRERRRVVARLRDRRRRGITICTGGRRVLEGGLRGLVIRVRVVSARRAARRLERLLRRLIGRRAAVRRRVPGRDLRREVLLSYVQALAGATAASEILGADRMLARDWQIVGTR